MPFHHLWHIDTHGRVIERGTLEVDVVIVRGRSNCSQHCQYGECVQHYDTVVESSLHCLSIAAVLAVFYMHILSLRIRRFPLLQLKIAPR
jgi:hypothetical protein